MKRLLAAVAVALACAPSAVAGPPPVTATSYLVLNASTGEVLASRAVHERVPMASITKLMTVLVALDRSRLNRQITVDAQAGVVGESSVHLRPGERLPLSDLVKAALIQSANDAAYAIAAGTAGGDVRAFVGAMNAKARRFHLKDTHFVRPDGLDVAGHYSSAWDVTRLAQIAMRKPFVRDVVDEQTDTIMGGRTLHTWNDLLGTLNVIGVKTGHTAGAGWCQVAAARGNGFTIYATILGSPSRAQRNSDLAALLRWGLSRYRVAQVISAQRTYARVATGYGRPPVPLIATKALRRAVHVRRPLVERVLAAGAVELPVRARQRLGVVRVYQGRRLIASRPLVAARAATKPGTLDRVGFYAKRTVKRAWGWLT